MNALVVPRVARPPDEHRLCPDCAPNRKAAKNRNRPTLGVWFDGKGGQTTWCIRCQVMERGAAHPFARSQVTELDPVERIRRANAIWSKSHPIAGTAGETYFRRARGISCVFPAAIRYLPASGRYSHAVVSAFGLVREDAGGQLEKPESVTAVHLTTLSSDAGTRLSKRMIGLVSGQPIVLAPLNDGLGLAICEGIEDALSIHEATGLGTWAAGAASFLPKLADVVPGYCDRVTVIADPDEQGQRMAVRLLDSLRSRGLNAEMRSLDRARSGSAV